MGKKYIIELLDECNSEFKGIMVFGLTPEGQIAAEPIPVEDLTPYTEPDLEQVRKEAYEQGYYIGYSKYNNKSFEDGLKESWEAARKIWDYDLDTLKEIFGKASTRMDIYKFFTASEVIEKLKAYEQEKEMDGLRQNIQTIVDKCGYSLDEIATVLEKMREGQDG